MNNIQTYFLFGALLLSLWHTLSCCMLIVCPILSSPRTAPGWKEASVEWTYGRHTVAPADCLPARSTAKLPPLDWRRGAACMSMSPVPCWTAGVHGRLLSRTHSSHHLHPEWEPRRLCASACVWGWRREGSTQARAAVSGVHAPVFQPAALRSWEIIEKKIYF